MSGIVRVFVEPGAFAEGFLFGVDTGRFGGDADRKEAYETVWIGHSDNGFKKVEAVAYAALIPT